MDLFLCMLSYSILRHGLPVGGDIGSPSLKENIYPFVACSFGGAFETV